MGDEEEVFTAEELLDVFGGLEDDAENVTIALLFVMTYKVLNGNLPEGKHTVQGWVDELIADFRGCRPSCEIDENKRVGGLTDKGRAALCQRN